MLKAATARATESAKVKNSGDRLGGGQTSAIARDATPREKGEDRYQRRDAK